MCTHEAYKLDMSITYHNVIIIGAGISGITALKQLLSGGVKNVAVFEATDCIGGRIRSFQYGMFFKLHMSITLKVRSVPRVGNSPRSKYFLC